MGIAFGLLGRLGFPSLDSLSTDKLYNEYFSGVKNEDEFLCAVVRLCSDFNAIMPGRHYTIDQTKVKEFYGNWSKSKGQDKDQGKSSLITFMAETIKDEKPNSFAMICTGCIAPAGAIAVKKSGEKIPQLKRFRIDLVPNFVVVPTFTLICLIGVRAFSLNRALKPK